MNLRREKSLQNYEPVEETEEKKSQPQTSRVLSEFLQELYG